MRNYTKGGLPLSHAQKLIVALKASEAVRYIHSLNILHRDIKPANFVVKVNGLDITISLVDFDSAIQLNSNQLIHWGSDNVGTFGYRAPESYAELSQYSRASDIYSLGCIFKYDLRLDSQIWNGMINDDMSLRDDIETVMQKIIPFLESHEIDPNVKTWLDETKANLLKRKSLFQERPAPTLVFSRNLVPSNIHNTFEASKKRRTTPP